MMVASVQNGEQIETQRDRIWKRRLNIFWGSWETRIAVFFLLALCVVALIPPDWWPESSIQSNLRFRHAKPSFLGGDSGFLLGADSLGRDILYRILRSTRLTLGISGIATLMSTITGTAAGLVAGFYRGWVDGMISRAVDVMLAFPMLLLVLALVTGLGQSVSAVVIVLALSGWAGYTRVLRSNSLALADLEFVQAARSLGAFPKRLLWRHLLPNVTSPLLVLSTFNLAQFLLAESSISFLGLGPVPPNTTWGSMIGDARNYINDAWWASLFPGLAIFLSVLAFNIVGDALRDAFDARTAVRTKGGDA